MGGGGSDSREDLAASWGSVGKCPSRPFRLSAAVDGPRPTAGHYTPMKKEGAIILGTGGDQSNGAHLPTFACGDYTMKLSNLSTAAVRAKGESSFFGPLLPTTFPWFAQNGGWEGLARIVPRLSIQVGHVTWRTEGLVALQAAIAGAIVVTKPLRAKAGSCTQLRASLNYRGGNATVELLDSDGTSIKGFSGVGASFVPEGTDDVALRLSFGSGAVLPAAIRGPTGVHIRVVMHEAGSQLFGISLRCATPPTKKRRH
eukprot:COSAG01_NODE_3679_length_5802_cov_347.111520_5_plen_257_part_00